MIGIDKQLTTSIRHLSLGPWDYVLALPSTLFGAPGMAFILLGMWLLKGAKFSLFVLCCSLLVLLITQSIKYLVRRQRPGQLQTPRRCDIGLPGNPSFPSGDSAQAGMITTLVLATEPASGWIPVWMPALMLLCMFGRVYYGFHWLSDTIAGVVIGSSVGVLGLSFITWIGNIRDTDALTHLCHLC